MHQPARTAESGLVIDRISPTLSTEQVAQILRLLSGADSVELKFSVPDVDRRSVVLSLGMDPIDAQIRQVVFFDTPDLALDRRGVVVRARRVQRKGGDAIVKLRPLVPDEVPAGLRSSDGFTVEVDAMPGGFVCSGALKATVADSLVKGLLTGDRPVRKLFTKRQRSLFAENAPKGLEMDDLAVLGPINVLKLKFTPADLARRLVAELWVYPDGSRVLELSTKCEPADAFDVASEVRHFLTGKGIDLVSEQQTKTRRALAFFAGELAGTTEPRG
jgi:hypothetical protein